MNCYQYISAPTDFSLLNTSVTFRDNSRQGDRQCFQVLVKGDNFIETDEVFNVRISPLYRDLLREPYSTTITIVHDGDGKKLIDSVDTTKLQYLV